MGKISEKMRKQNSKICGINDKVAALILLTVLATVIFLLLRLSIYTAPYYDDYSYSYDAHEAVLNKAGLFGVLKAAGLNTVRTYNTWQGTYSSCFLMSLMPGIFGEQFYFLGPVFLIMLLTASVFFFSDSLVRFVFKGEVMQSVCVSSILTIMALMLIHSAQQGLYWYNAGIHYIGGHSFALIMCAFLIRLIYKDNLNLPGRIGCISALIISSLLVSGSNFVTVLQGMSVVFLFLLISIAKKKRVVGMSFISVLYATGMYINLSAPGNLVRQARFANEGYPAFKAIILSFREAALWFWKLTGPETVAFLVLLAPFIWNMLRNNDMKFRYPVVFVVLGFCFYAMGFTPSLYSTGRMDLARVVNAVKLTLQIVLFADEIYIIGHFKNKIISRVNTSKNGKPYIFIIFCIMWAAAFCVIFSLSKDKAGSFSAYGAYYYVHTGEAFNYRSEYLKRVEMFNSPNDEVIVDPYVFKPWFLCKKEDLSTDPQAEINVITARYYHKLSLKCR